MPQLPLSLASVKKLLTEKYPPQTENERVYASILLAQADSIDKINTQTDELVKAARVLGALLAKMQIPAADMAAAAAAAEAPEASEADEGPRDNTPFPAGAKSEARGATGPATLDETQAEAIPTPDVASQPAVNPAPVPKAPSPKGPTPNVASNGNGAKL